MAANNPEAVMNRCRLRQGRLAAKVSWALKGLEFLAGGINRCVHHAASKPLFHMEVSVPATEFDSP